MTAQLQQILAYFDRDGVTELVFATNRAIAMRQNGTYVNLTARPLTLAMLNAFVDGTPLAALLPQSDAATEPTEVDVGARRLRVRTGRRGDEVVVRLEPLQTPVPRAAPRPPGSPQASTSPGGSVRGSTGVVERPSTPNRDRDRDERHGGVPKQPAAPPHRPDESVSSPPGGGLDLSPQQPLTLDLPGAGPISLESELAPSPTSHVSPPAAAQSALKVAMEPGQHAHVFSSSVALTPFGELVAAARAAGASDLHISAGRVVAIRQNSELVPLDAQTEPLDREAVERLLKPLLETEQEARLNTVGYVDLAVEAPGGGRLRANISRHQVGWKGTFRLALAAPRNLDELGLPKDLAKVVAHHQGFVVIAGPSGHGKTTTLAALVDLVNSTKAGHILLVEDPIEIVHPRKLAVISQREAGRHTKTFASALKASLREDPDVIVIGELRDRETVEIALTASETGHLVIATMSTPSAAKTLDRLIDMFPPEDHSQVRASIAGALRAIVAQRLLPGVDGGVVPAIELVTGVVPLAALIRDDKLYQLPNLMQRGRSFGMIRFDESLAELVRAGKISEDTALSSAHDRKDFAARLKKGV